MSRRGSSITVCDPEGLAALLRRVLDQRFEGRQRDMARAAKLNPGLVSKLLRGVRDAVSPETRDALRRLAALVRGGPARLEQCLWTPGMARMLNEGYGGWVRDGLAPSAGRARLWQFDNVHGEPEPVRPYAAVPPEKVTQLQFRALRKWARHECPREAKALDELAARHGAERIDLAWQRALDGVLHYWRSGCVELAWTELRDTAVTKLRRYVRAGLERELLLLDRAPARDRIRDAYRRHSNTAAAAAQRRMAEGWQQFREANDVRPDEDLATWAARKSRNEPSAKGAKTRQRRAQSKRQKRPR